MLDAARHVDAVIYPVVPGKTPRLGHNPYEFLTQLADVAGGHLIAAAGPRDLRVTFNRILAEFRQRYMLSYSPALEPARGWHHIDVRLKGASGVVTARRGYFIG